MTTAVSKGLKHKASTSSYLRLGFDELAWDQYQQDEDARLALLGEFRKTGLLINHRPNGFLEADWLVSEDPLNPGCLVYGTATSGTQCAVTAEGRVLQISNQHRPYTLTSPWALLLTVPDTATWYTLVLRAGFTAYEPGTLAFSSDVNLVGTGTAFARYSSYAEGGVHGTYIRIAAADEAALGAFDSGLGAGVYELATILSGTTATLTAAAPVTVGSIPFTIAGDYRTPPAVASRDEHVRQVPTFALLARTREAGVNDVILADVYRTGGVMTIVDRRRQGVAYAKEPCARPVVLQPRAIPISTGTGALVIDYANLVAGAAADNYTGVDVTWNDTLDGNGLIVAYSRNGAGVYTRTFNPVSLAVGAEVTVDATAQWPAIIQVPYPNGAFGYKLQCYYTDGTVLYFKESTDQGATWPGAAVAVWDPHATNPAWSAEENGAIVLQNHRILVATNVTGLADVRLVYSDTYGASWVTNAGSGYTFGAAGVTRARFWQDIRRGYVYATTTGVASSTMFATKSTLGLTGYSATVLNAGQEGCVWVSEHGDAHVVGEIHYLNQSIDIVASPVAINDSGASIVPLSAGYHQLRIPIYTGGGALAFHYTHLSIAQTRNGMLWLAYQASSDAAAALVVQPVIPVAGQQTLAS